MNGPAKGPLRWPGPSEATGRHRGERRASRCRRFLDRVTGLPSLGDSITWLGNAVPSLGRSITWLGSAVPSLGRSITWLGNAVPSLGNAVPSLGRSITWLGSAVPSLGNAVPSLGNAVPSLGRPITWLGNAVPSLGWSSPWLAFAITRLAWSIPRLVLPNPPLEVPAANAKTANLFAEFRLSSFAIAIASHVLGAARLRAPACYILCRCPRIGPSPSTSPPRLPSPRTTSPARSSVAELDRAIKGAVEDAFSAAVWVEGEVTGARPAPERATSTSA